MTYSTIISRISKNINLLNISLCVQFEEKNFFFYAERSDDEKTEIITFNLKFISKVNCNIMAMNTVWLLFCLNITLLLNHLYCL